MVSIKEKAKKYFLNLKLSKKQLISACPVPKRSLWFGVLLFFIILGFSFPVYHTYAISIPGLGGIANAIGDKIGGVIAAFLTVIPASVMAVAGFILQWSIDPTFISLPSYTKGGIVDIGWPVVRDIANMGIVLALVAIGLATALRIEEYQARRTLPRLILVALLINFTPVILGVIVDFTNTIMYFFLGGLMGVEFITRIFSSIHSIVVSDLGNFPFFNPLQLGPFMAKIVIIWIFYLIVAIVFLLFAVVFIMRRIVIWMLVIFSPIAFVAWILPGTRGLWSMWWKQFTQWSIIGVSCAFFLYLGDHMIGLAASGGFMGDAPSGLGGIILRPFITMAEQLMPYFIATLFLLFGFFIALTSSAMGSAGAINFARRGTKAVANVVRREAWDKGKTFAQERAAKSGTWRRTSERMALAKEAPAAEKIPLVGRVPGVRRVVRQALRPTWAAGRAIGRVGLRVRDAGPKEIRVEEEKAKKWETPEMKLSHLRSAMTKTERAGILYAAYEAKQLKPLEKLGLSLEEVEKTGREALELHPDAFQKFKKAYPDVASKIKDSFPKEIQDRAGMTLNEEEETKYKGSILNKIMDGMKTDDVEKMAPTSLGNEKVTNAIHEFWTGPQIAAAARAFGKDFVDTFEATADKKGLDWYLENNPKVPIYLASNAAQDLGLRSLGGLGPDQTREEIKRWRTPDGTIEREIAETRTALEEGKTRINELRQPSGVLRRVPKEKEEEAKKVEGELGKIQEKLERDEKLRERKRIIREMRPPESAEPETPPGPSTRKGEDYRRRFLGGRGNP
jgi:hypothetical protein